MSVLEVRGLSAGHSGVAAVRDVDIDVAAGEIVALLGPNGAGKTTLLDTVAGVLPALGGTVLLNGNEVSGVRSAARLGTGYVREGRGLFAQLTVSENLRLRTRSRKAMDAAVKDFPALQGLGSRRVGLLSGGEQQILALACALARQPRLLLVDEMTMGVAPIIVRQLMALVRRAADQGVAVLFVEQHLHAALELSDRAYVLRQGRLVMSGASADLVSRLGEVADSYFDGHTEAGPAPGEPVGRTQSSAATTDPA